MFLSCHGPGPLGPEQGHSHVTGTGPVARDSGRIA